jgi:hypothetical protein
VITAGQRGDSPQFAAVLERIKVYRVEGGRPRTRPDLVLADKAYTSRGNRGYARRRRIRVCIPSKADQDAHRKAKGSRGGRPPAFDPRQYRLRHAFTHETVAYGIAEEEIGGPASAPESGTPA